MNTCKYINKWTAILLYLFLTLTGCGKAIHVSESFNPELDAARADKKSIDEKEVNDFRNYLPKPGKKPYVKLEGVNITLGGNINLKTRKLDLTYSLKNKMETSMQLRMTQASILNDSRIISLPARADKTETYTSDLKVTQLSAATSQVVFRPYLLGETDKKYQKPVLSKYDTDLKISLPRNARLVKSNVALKKISSNEYNWKVKGAPILPPVNLWYTTADENISATMNLAKGDTVVVTIEVKNNSSTTARGLKLLTRFPVGKFEPVTDESDGKFTIKQSVMYIWTHEIKELVGNSTKQLKLTLKNLTNDQFPNVQEIAIHNMKGDLVAITE